MSSLADAPNLVGFFSYSRDDDEDSGGRLSKLRERIQAELRGQLGRTKADFRLWQDKVAIADGELWEETIKKGISESVFFIPIITPTAIRSRYCKFEFESFLAREKELDRNNVIFPILYIPVPALTDERWRQDPTIDHRKSPIRGLAEFAAPRCFFKRGCCPTGPNVLRKHLQGIAATVVVAGRMPAG